MSVEAAGDYTPFGYLRNPHHHVITWWAKCTGGNLRTADETLGLEWVYPWHKDRAACAGISLVTSIDGRVCRLRSDFAGLGYTSRHHSADVLGFDWSVHEVGVAARFFLVDAALCVRVRLANLAPDARRTRIGVFGRAWTRDGAVATRADASGVVFEMPADGPAPRAHALVGSERSGKPSLVEHDHEMWAGWDVELQLGAGEHAELVAALGRGAEPTAAYAAARGALAQARPTLQRRLAEDSAFRAACPRLTGDWPADWPNGLVYDLETTRALVRPAAGIFSDVWPAWMAAWPRVVLAEASLDMLRLTLADPGLAERALLSLFRDAPLPNVPCVLEDGSDTMVAADGSRCGTSPAWCLPFLNIELVYLRTLDRAWLAELYPHLAAYVAWWLEHRTDGRGWLVYRCTWESGEDGNPRLDPSGSGHAVISDHVRPVELQATLAQAASSLAFFARELGREADMARWHRLRTAYRRRTQRLFDPHEGRFRDWLIAERRFTPPCPEQPYWGVDACRWSPLSLTPLLGRIAIPAQVDRLRPEVVRHATAPWTSWPSWAYVLLECAAASGLYEEAGEIAWEIIDRVYRVTNRRDLAQLASPTPGAAPEFWPQDWRTFNGCDAYGWGATTANLLVRHLIGFKESRVTRRWSALLTPGLPLALRVNGRRYTIRGLLYRGLRFDLSYVVEDTGIVVDLDLPRPMRLHVRQVSRGVRALCGGRTRARRHRFAVEIGRAYRLELRD